MTQSQSLKRKAINGVLWRIGEQGASQALQFVISIILARLIMPDQFGMIAMLTIFISLANVFVNSGFSTALTRKTDYTQADCSTVYWYNIIVSIACYIILFFSAPLVSDFYSMPQLTSLLRVTAIGIIISSLVGVHRTLLNIELNFKALTKYNLLSLILSGVVGITLAYLDFKVWALALQSLSASLISSICIWFNVKWRPSFIFSRKSLKEFFSFGSKLLGSSLLDTLYTNMYGIIIGKVYRASDLAFYNRAQSLNTMTSNTPTSVLQSVTFPTLCKLKEDDVALKNGYRRMLRLASFVVFPICLGAGAVAYPLINVLYTERWIYAATLLSITCFASMWYPIHAINLNYLMVKGRSDLFFRLEVIKKIQAVIILCITIPIGLEAMCWGNVVSSLLSLIWNTHYNSRMLHMGILSQLRDLLPTMLLSAAMYIGVKFISILMGNGITSLACSILAGVAIYVTGAFVFRFPEIKELRNLRK